MWSTKDWLIFIITENRLDKMNMDNRITLILFAFFMSGCIAVKYHDYATNNQIIAIETIKKLKQDTLLIVIPTFHQKEDILKSLAKKSKRNKTEHRSSLLRLYAERQIQQESLIRSFIKNYSFSSLLFIPDSLIHKQEAGIEGYYFLNEFARIDSTIHLANTHPIKLIQQFDQEWQIKIGNQMIPNPFPNYYVYRNGLYGFLGNETYDKMYDRVAKVFQKRFEQFHANPDRRIYL